MTTRIHMKDQIHNRIKELMDEGPHHDWNDIFQNAATLALVALFMALGLNW